MHTIVIIQYDQYFLTPLVSVLLDFFIVSIIDSSRYPLFCDFCPVHDWDPYWCLLDHDDTCGLSLRFLHAVKSPTCHKVTNTPKQHQHAVTTPTHNGGYLSVFDQFYSFNKIYQFKLFYFLFKAKKGYNSYVECIH